ncbi:polysaccharide deacetylase family protein [Roseateles koreensis]|uniref:Polysaccharide deacetylase family protein n=1 Tax=Roseateles koreensis TaxID=2987526 RepID=A0ABT5KTH3_9BURK|nr:polysaccharide deacetylase family protein [Roseateles koreensis]MDC8786243.1 polysaccharide deacetylase family protein [Roseateles koreensis]
MLLPMPRLFNASRFSPAKRLCHGAALLLICCPHLTAWADIAAKVDAMVGNQRKIWVLRDDATPANRGEARRAGQYLYFTNLQLGQSLLAELGQNPDTLPRQFKRWAEAMDKPEFSDEDRLVFRGPLEAALPRLGAEEHQDADARLERLSALRHVLGADFLDAFNPVPLKARPYSPRWTDYVKHLAQQQSSTQILSELADTVQPGGEASASAPTQATGPGVPGVPELAEQQRALKARALEWNGEELPERTLLLTFDDGPHPVHTPAVLDILQHYGLKAIFFQVGRNLGELQDGHVSATRNEALERRIVAEGHAIGNHSYTHPQLPRLSTPQVDQEIADTQKLLDHHVPTGPARTGTFRPPFGARDDRVLAEIEQHGLRSVIWNIDSEDWADPLPSSIAHRIVSEAEKNGRGIVLMHDIHARTVEALPQVIEQLLQRGFRFAHWDGSHLVANTPLPVAPAEAAALPSFLAPAQAPAPASSPAQPEKVKR